MDTLSKILGLVESWIVPERATNRENLRSITEIMSQARAREIIRKTTEIMCRNGDRAGVKFLQSQILTHEDYIQHPLFAVCVGLAYLSSGDVETGKPLVLLGLNHGDFSLSQFQIVTKALDRLPQSADI